MSVSSGPLTRERVLSAAVSLADQSGIASLSMRKLGQRLGVEAMSLYNHVANKDDVLDGMVEVVVAEFELPSPEANWQAALRLTARTAREVLLRHPWAPALIESRATRSDVRFRYAEAVVGTLRRAGFPIELAYRAQLTLNSYIYGFTLHEINPPFEPEERQDVAAAARLQVSPDEYPFLTEVMDMILQAGPSRPGRKGATTHASEFEFGLDLILDGLERLKRELGRQGTEV